MKTTLGRLFKAILVAALVLAAASIALPAKAQTLDVVHRFQSGGAPQSRLIHATDGFFYGTTRHGGTNNVGSIFRLDTSGVLTTLHSFGYTEGAFPDAALLQAADGNFYGTATQGGANSVGTVFKMSATGVVTLLHSFSWSTDGANPEAPLIETPAGTFYGTTHGGTVFRMDSAGNLTTLAHVGQSYAALIKSTDGYFYGTTSGAVFKMDSAGTVTTLHEFGNRSSHAALVQGTDGNLYGTTVGRVEYLPGRTLFPGYVFRIDPFGSFTVLHTFPSGEQYPYDGVIQASDGSLYGTSYSGYSGAGDGTIFKVDLTGHLTTLYGFSQADGAHPHGGLLQTGNDLYGTTTTGGANGAGTVFKMDLSASLTTLCNFANAEGSSPQASLIQAPDGAFYGTTSGGGVSNLGTIFKVDSTGTLSTLHSFTGVDGAYADAPLLRATDGQFYGTTYLGGANGYGTVFKIDSAGTFTLLHSFVNTDGANPSAALIQAIDGDFYGSTSYGGANGYGTIFKIDSAGTLTPRHDFSGTDGGHPSAPLIQTADGTFYGTTADTVFKMDSAGNITTIHTFTLAGSIQVTLILATDGFFYGTTSNYGTVFQMDSAGNVITLAYFGYPNGLSALIQAPDGYFYGTTSGDGDYNDGTVFKVDASGTLTTLYSLQPPNIPAYTPAGLIRASDGSVWGTTPSGGFDGGYGTVFRLITSGPNLDVTAVSPSSGLASGLTAVTITGTNFNANARVTIGEAPALLVSVENASTVSALAPELKPGTLNDVTVINPDTSWGTGSALWFADFLDVPQGDDFHADIETIFRHGITAGCGEGNYCRDNPVTRAQMAVFLLKAEHGSDYVPPTCAGTFPDVPCPSLFANWIEQFAAEGITAGCGGGLYCPDSSVTRRQMAVFLLKAKEGSGHTPPPAAGIFGDVPLTDAYSPWIEELYNRQITAGCQASPLLYCPDNSNTRGQMAVFLTRTFGLQ